MIRACIRILTLIILVSCSLTVYAQHSSYYLIAHRGGVVDSTYTENGLPALQAAIKRGYKMVEVDLRITKDSVLIIHHDNNFKRYYGIDQPVKEMAWEQWKYFKINKQRSMMCKINS